MKFDQWDAHFKTLKSHTNLLLASNLLLIGLLAVSIWGNLSSRPVVVVQPLISNQPLEIKANSLTKSYAISFGLSMALLLGNVTSGNASFVLESIANYVSPEYFAKFRKQLVADMTRLRDNRMDMTFTATNSSYDVKTNEVVIDGISSIVDPAGQRINSRHQFRFQLKMDDYVPRITAIKSLDVKEG